MGFSGYVHTSVAVCTLPSIRDWGRKLWSLHRNYGGYTVVISTISEFKKRKVTEVSMISASRIIE